MKKNLMVFVAALMFGMCAPLIARTVEVKNESPDLISVRYTSECLNGTHRGLETFINPGEGINRYHSACYFSDIQIKNARTGEVLIDHKDQAQAIVCTVIYDQNEGKFKAICNPKL
jgi:hypothetical protein